MLLATRAAWTPFDTPDASLLISDDIAYTSPINLFDWDTADAGDGCWQPYAVVIDPIEGVSYSKGAGRITVAHGGNVPPAVWVTTAKSELPDDAGNLTLDWELDEPDDPSRVSITWFDGRGEQGSLVANLPLSAGTRTASYTFDVHRLPPRPLWLRLDVTSGDGGWCDAWWQGFVTGQADAPDAGVDAGTLDGGAGPGDKAGCGCGSAPQLFFLCALALLKRRRK
ncbi:MAG: hypothetical protein IPJ65_37595 [Archangiaceae bacterium]|nr:hypothetical protein [Archangiaceae bacterium]